MPDKLAEHRKRVSFAEDREVLEVMKQIAEREGKTLTDLYAEAAQLLIKSKTTKKKSK